MFHVPYEEAKPLRLNESPHPKVGKLKVSAVTLLLSTATPQ